MKDYKNLLKIVSFDSKRSRDYVNILKVYMKWDANDADYIERTDIITPNALFKNKKLILCLAYISTKYNFKGHDWNDSVFGQHITDNIDIEGLKDILKNNDFAVYSEYGLCHSCEDLKIIYFDENGNKFKISFDKIYEHWKNLTYQEICDEINNIPDKE